MSLKKSTIADVENDIKKIRNNRLITAVMDQIAAILEPLPPQSRARILNIIAEKIEAGEGLVDVQKEVIEELRKHTSG